MPIEVRKHGMRGPVVAVLHGGPGAQGSAIGLARGLADDFQVLEPLQRLSGREPLSVSRHVEDMRVVLPDPVALVGWSWGAMLGLSYAARYPGSVTALALVGCGTYDPVSRASIHPAIRERLDPDSWSRLQHLQGRFASEGSDTDRDGILAEIADLVEAGSCHELLPDSAPRPGEVVIDARGHEETWADVLRLQEEGIEPSRFAAIRSRVLMLHGDVDPHPGPATRDLLRRYLPHLEYVPLERCGHEPWRERHARSPFLRTLRHWLLDEARC
mgnify:CR=1 FL=1